MTDPLHAPAPGLYRPPVYDAADPAALVRDYPLALLVSPPLHASATPVLFERDDTVATLVGHLARRNAHALALRSGDDALAIFSGPNAYVSPRWYVEKPQVPTWNYLCAQVRGRIEVIDDDDGQLAVLARIAEVGEARWPDPWTLQMAPPGRVEQLLPLIRSFRIHVERIDGATKLSQSHPPGDRTRVAAGLAGSPLADEREVARLMRELP
ncbi:MAG: FMN-binding negative transcriptional regulator [Pseudoxanthomonas sp.]